jgi:hypothetical protein
LDQQRGQAEPSNNRREDGLDHIDMLPAVDQGQQGASAEHLHSRRRAAYLTAGMGIAHAVLFLLAFWLFSTAPGPKAPDAEIVNYYSSGDTRRLLLVGLYVMPFSGIAFLWFAVALRMWIAASTRRIDALLSNVQLVSGIIFITLLLAGAGASTVVAASVEYSDAPINDFVARQFPAFGSVILIVFALRMAAMFVFTTSNIGRGSGALPRWFVYLGYAVGLLLLLSASLSPFLALVFPLWVLALCVILLGRARQIPAGAILEDRLRPAAPPVQTSGERTT